MKKALSIKQPWASLIAHGIKDIENRTWKTKFRGRIYIHASGTPAKGITTSSLTSEQFDSLPNVKFKVPNSAIIGEVDIIDCVINHPSIWSEKTEYFGKICNENKCPEFIKWDMEGGSCESCKLVGQSYYVEEIPKKCLHKEKMPKPTYNWVLANPVLYDKPILNVKGKLSFWDWKGCEQTCESCENVFDMNDMQRDGADNYFCNPCADELFPIMQKEYEEMVAKGEIEPED